MKHEKKPEPPHCPLHVGTPMKKEILPGKSIVFKVIGQDSVRWRCPIPGCSRVSSEGSSEEDSDD
jgi:hypothetical protein